MHCTYAKFDLDDYNHLASIIFTRPMEQSRKQKASSALKSEIPQKLFPFKKVKWPNQQRIQERGIFSDDRRAYLYCSLCW